MNHPTPNSADFLSQSISMPALPDVKTSLSLLAKAQKGDTRALEDLVERYQERLRRIVRIQLGTGIVRRQFDSMDIVQNTFRAALPKIGDLRPRSAAGLLQWLSMIATNQIRDAHDHVRAGKRDAAREVGLAASSMDSTGGAVLEANDASPEEQAYLNEVREMLDEEVAKLPDDQRRVILMRDYCGEDWDRISLELGRESTAARQLHQRAWIRLRQALRPKLGGPNADGEGAV